MVGTSTLNIIIALNAGLSGIFPESPGSQASLYGLEATISLLGYLVVWHRELNELIPTLCLPEMISLGLWILTPPRPSTLRPAQILRLLVYGTARHQPLRDRL
jgi:hypothetical protein